jgi:transcriptional regulator with XRE-family HTH domain
MDQQHLPQRLAATVAARLEAAGITQRAAADATQIPLTTLNRRLSGATPFNYGELAAVALLLGTTPSELAAAAEAAA